MMLILAAAILGAAGAPPVRLAGWERTRWSMSPSEVGIVLQGRATMIPRAATLAGASLWLGATADYKRKGLLLFAEFFFDARSGLARVRLTPKDASKCEALHADLLAAHGSPIEANRPMMNDRLVDRARGNRIAFTEPGRGPGPRSCTVSYTPLHAAII